jgi:TolB protein
MFALESQHATPRLRRSPLPRLLVLAVPLALGACDGADSPLAPAGADDALAPATESVAPADALAALTAPRIAFMSYRYNDYPNLYLMDPLGKNVVRRTSWTGDAGAPAWSYDNKKIALSRARLDAAKVRHEDIYLMNADGTNKRWARSLPSSFNITDPSWSPDGSRLVVAVNLGGTEYLATLELATGNMAFVKENGTELVPGSNPSYHPTGKSILYSGPDGKTVEEVYPDGDGYVLVSPGMPVGRPIYSPDGKKFAYSRVVSGNNMEIFVQNRATYAAKRLTYSSAYDGEPSWSPDGMKIAFVSGRSGRHQIWTMSSTTGGGLTRITQTTAGDVSPAFSH